MFLALPILLSLCHQPPDPGSARALEVAVEAGDAAALSRLLPGQPGLERWLVRQERGGRLVLDGSRFQLGEHSGILGARLRANPGRWAWDRWPLGDLLHGEQAEPLTGGSLARVAGTITFDRSSGSIEGRVSVRAIPEQGLVALRLHGERVRWWRPRLLRVSRGGRPVPWHSSGGVWVFDVPSADGEVVLDLHYAITLPELRFPLLEPDVILLSRYLWLPTELDASVDPELDVRLEGLGALDLRSGGGLSRGEAGWRLWGPASSHELIVARPSWTLRTAEIRGTTVEVATDPAGDTDPDRLVARVTEALEALGGLGPLPPRLSVTEVPGGRAARASTTHVVFPEGELDRKPLSFAHELVHVLCGRHTHPPPGLPGVEEPMAEYLAQRAARDPGEATALRRRWQHAMARREGDDGRPLLDAYRLHSAQYFRGALILQGLADRLGEDRLLELLLPLEQSTGTWHTLRQRVVARDQAAGDWLWRQLEAQDLPAPTIEQGPDRLWVVDAGDTGLPVELELHVRDSDSTLEARQIDLGAPLSIAPGATEIVIDPYALAPIRLLEGEVRVPLR